MLINRKTRGRPHLSARTVKIGRDKAHRGIISQGPEKGTRVMLGGADLGPSLKIGGNREEENYEWGKSIQSMLTEG